MYFYDPVCVQTNGERRRRYAESTQEMKKSNIGIERFAAETLLRWVPTLFAAAGIKLPKGVMRLAFIIRINIATQANMKCRVICGSKLMTHRSQHRKGLDFFDRVYIFFANINICYYLSRK